MIVIFKIVNGKKWCQICVTDKSKIINDDDDCIETFGNATPKNCMWKWIFEIPRELRYITIGNFKIK